ncbi:MAG: formimidoylglutamate deiminase [Acidimicrobiaceae bacterium]|nr:formimidoylglutamate deiminase [Acidimicrobiaceae bacterium]MYE08884.1 formimidoylglutamate deiminase [Acidimicrobiaceae bacterium]MYI36106.1 formimidoylglutamate deiminase [Acidimicrobiaceae bacterium]
MTARYWCERAWLGGPRADTGVVIEVEGNRIDSVAAGVRTRPEDAVPLAGLTLPALANAHSHAFHRALRGRTHCGRGNFWTWRDLMYRVAARLDPDRYYRLARAVFAEMALAGIGTVGEFHYVHHRPGGGAYDDPNAMGAVLVAAARDAGLRLTLLDTLYLHGGLDADSSRGYRPLRPEQARFSDGSAECWAERAEGLAAAVSGPAVKVGAAVHSVRAVDPASIKVAVDWARGRDAPLHFHASEQPAENEHCLAVHDRTPVEVIAEAGGLGPGTTLVHATHITDQDRALIGEAGAHCCFCPTTEHDLADGVGPAEALARAGARLCVGSDSHAVIDLFAEARMVELDQRAASGDRGVLGVEDLAAMATAAGYRSLGWPEGGTLEAGALADFVTVGLDSVRLAGTDGDNALAAVIFAATAADVRHLVVGGKAVVRKGRHTTINVATELASAVEEVTAP